MPKLETALTFENPEDGSALQIEMDTNGYALTVFDADGSVATLTVETDALHRLTTFLNHILIMEQN